MRGSVDITRPDKGGGRSNIDFASTRTDSSPPSPILFAMTLAFKRLILPLATCGLVLALVAASIFASWQGLRALAMVIIIVAALVLTVSLFSTSPRSYVVFSPGAGVVERVGKTLQLLTLQFHHVDGRFIVAKTGTLIKVLPLGPLSAITFVTAEDCSAREQYLANAIMKYQRYVGH